MPAGSSGFGQSPGAFGSQSPQPFGTPSAGFGAASSPAFGQTQSMPAFGASSTPAFGSSGFGTGTPNFGQSSAPAFGQSSAPAFGQTPAFGSQSTPAFGGAFGAPQSAPAFGGGATSNPFGQSTPAFGSSSGFGFSTPQQSSSGFGTPQSAPAFGSTGFGGFGQGSTPAFGGGASAAPAFGQQPQQQSTPAFSFSTGGGFGTPQQSPGFGTAASTPGFGAASAPSFGNLFGNNQQTQQKPGGFGGFGQSNPAGGFGASSTPGFGQSQSNSIFGAPAQSAPAFGGTYGQPAPAFGSTGFGQPTQQQQQPFLQQPQQQQQQLVPIGDSPAACLTISKHATTCLPSQDSWQATVCKAVVLYAADPNNPYGQLPDAPKIPDYPVGLAAKPGLGTVFSRSSPLLAPRPISRPLAASTYGKPAAAGRARSRYTGGLMCCMMCLELAYKEFAVACSMFSRSARVLGVVQHKVYVMSRYKEAAGFLNMSLRICSTLRFLCYS